MVTARRSYGAQERDERGEYQLVDSETANVVGFYESLGAALRDVAETVAAYGLDAPEVRSLSLIRLDVPAGRGHVAAGIALARRAQAFGTGAAVG